MLPLVAFSVATAATAVTTPIMINEGISCNAKACHLMDADWQSWNVSICADPQYEMAEIDSELVSALMAVDDGEESPVWGKNYTLVLIYLPTCPFSAKMGATLSAVAVGAACNVVVAGFYWLDAFMCLCGRVHSLK